MGRKLLIPDKHSRCRDDNTYAQRLYVNQAESSFVLIECYQVCSRPAPSVRLYG